jgi:DNA-binding beta-propeller fold protein YncE
MSTSRSTTFHRLLGGFALLLDAGCTREFDAPGSTFVPCSGTETNTCAAGFVCVDDHRDICDVAWGDSSCPRVCAPLPTPEEDQASQFTVFESGQVRPMAMSPNGDVLFVVNTPDSRLEMFEIGDVGLKHIDSIPVGLEPVAVAARTDSEVWVVNHLSDSVSIVDTGAQPRRAVRTLLVGDEPSDIVFAGTKAERAFVSTAHRGQNIPYDPELTKPGIGRADIWVFDANAVVQSDSLGGEPLHILHLFTDTPRALAVSPDRSRVYAAGFLTGNRTTVVPHEVVTKHGGRPDPVTNFEGVEQPEASLVVRFDGSHWVDELDRSWDEHVKFALPDKDVFVIDADGDPPTQLDGTDGFYAGVGTVLYNMVVNPKSKRVYVSNTEARNQVRFEGEGLGGTTTVRGHMHTSRISVLDAQGKVTPRDLNKHIDYTSCCASIPNDENSRSLAIPTEMVVTSDGATLYVAALGSNKVGVLSTSELEDNSFQPSVADQIQVSGGGPSGLVLDEARGRLYVLTRFNNAISVIDTASRLELAALPMFNPEPASVVEGRPVLYDASFSSSHGDSACASCHVFGDVDGLAWDLGDPDGSELPNAGPFALLPVTVGSGENVNFRPLKGPMTTQSLRGLANHGAMHWRGDRTNSGVAPSVQPESGAFDEEAAFAQFNPAFPSLLGRSEEISDEAMQRFTDFALQITYPPNPIRALDNSLTASQEAGRQFYFERISDRLFACNGCHRLDPSGNAQFGVAKPGFFGTEGRYSFEFEPQIMKIPHFRNLYQKVGMFGMPATSKLLPDTPEGDNRFMGDQIRGFGFLHDGSNDTLFRFLTTVLFRYVAPAPGDPGNPGGFSPDPGVGDAERRDVEAFLLAFDTNLAPIVGQQVTIGPGNAEAAEARVGLLMERADLGECDLVARLSSGVGYLYIHHDGFRSNRAAESVLSYEDLRTRGDERGFEMTFTCTPPGAGVRMALDRDGDGFYDGDELDLDTNPDDRTSMPR